MGSAITKTPSRGTSIIKRPLVIKQWSKVVLNLIAILIIIIKTPSKMDVAPWNVH